MKKYLFLIFIIIFSWKNFGQTIVPTPQQARFTGETCLPDAFDVRLQDVLTSPLPQLLQKKSQELLQPKKMTIFIGDRNFKSVEKYASKVPKKSEGYYLRIDENNIYVIGNDPRGTYYGIRTLEQLFSLPKLPLGEIIDYPDLTDRGVVEGFYGTPWSHEKRLRQLEFYGKFKLNTYIYAPKDDPYHSSPNWRLPYPKEEARQIRELVQESNQNYVNFVWAIHPGKDIKWNDEDRNHLLNKFEMMYDLGVRVFAVFFDDISGEGTNPQKQVELLNFLHNEFVTKKKDVKPLIMCPTEYNKSWSNPEKKYLETLGTELHPSIRIMWTGNRVVADIDKPTMEWINTKIKRKAYIWWNFPVSDYVRNHMLLGAVYGNSLDIKNDMSGFVSNPMEHSEASKIAIYGVADYTWNIEKYQSDRAWKNAIAELMPENQRALFVFAEHNSDLGANGHQYRREESVVFKPIAEVFLKKLNSSSIIDTEEIHNHFEQMVWAANELLQTSENKCLTEELHPWLLQFKTLGQRGVSVMKMLDFLQEQQYDHFKKEYENLLTLQKKAYEIDITYNQNPYQPGIKTGTLVVEPFINQVLINIVNRHNKQTKSDLKLVLNFNPNTLITNVKQLESQPLLQRGNSVRISPVLEYISLKNNSFLGIKLQEKANIKTILVDFGDASHISKGKIEISADGTNWISLEGDIKNTRWQNKEVINNVKYIRFINNSTQAYQVQLKQFEIVVE